MVYYYPLCSKDFTFENIFSSESVSPPFFYKKRGFGIEYFYVIPEVNYDEAIILYSDPPKFEVSNSIKFVLQIEENCLNLENLLFVCEGVFAYQKTIYLNKDNFTINFFSEKDKKISMLKAETSLPTKSLEKYRNNFKIIDEESCVKYAFDTQIYNIKPYDTNALIREDKKYNQFKGLAYGIATGLSNHKPHEEILFRRLLREIINSFAELKSRVAESKHSYPKNQHRKSENSDVNLSVSKLLGLVQTMEQSYYDLFIDLNLDDDNLAKILFENNSKVNSVDDAKQFMHFLQIGDEAFGTRKFIELKKRYCRLDHSNQSVHVERLKSHLHRFIDEAIYSSNTISDLSGLNDSIKISLFEIERSVSINSKVIHKEQKFSMSGLSYDFDKNEIFVADNFQNLTSNEITDMMLINNVILKFSERNKSVQTKEAILQIVRDVGSLFSKGGKDTLLYQYLNNEIDTYAFEKITNSVMKSFVAFIFNIESLEKLEDFIITKSIEKDWIAYSFWGSFNGFANLSGNFTKTIFSSDAENIQNYIDTYLSKYIALLKAFSPDDNKERYVEENNNDYETAPTIDEVKNFYLKFVFGKFDISKEEFSSIVSIKDKDAFCKAVKSNFKMNKRNAEKLFNSIQRDFGFPLLFNE